MGETSTNFKITKLRSFFLPYLGMCTFSPNIVQSTLYSERHTLFDARDINKSKHTYFYKSSVRFTAVSAFLLAVHFTPVGWSILPQSFGVIHEPLSGYVFLITLRQLKRKKHILYDHDRKILTFK